MAWLYKVNEAFVSLVQRDNLYASLINDSALFVYRGDYGFGCNPLPYKKVADPGDHGCGLCLPRFLQLELIAPLKPGRVSVLASPDSQ
jgi:hypothetical protein